MLTPIEQSAVASGYVKCPNHSERWYPGGPGIPSMPYFMDVYIESPPAATDWRIQDSWPVALRCNVYGSGANVLVARFENWERYMEFAKEHGVLSKPGLPAFLFGD